MNRLLPMILLLAVIQSAHAAGMPMMVHSDAKQFGDDSDINACALLLTATSINGEYISVVIKLLEENGKTAMDYTVLSGNIDYSNGKEVYDYVENAWLTADDVSTRGNVKAGRGPSDYAYQARYSNNALSFYDSLVHAPFELTLITALHNKPFSHTFEQPFDQFVSTDAESCLQGYKAQHAASDRQRDE